MYMIQSADGSLNCVLSNTVHLPLSHIDGNLILQTRQEPLAGHHRMKSLTRQFETWVDSSMEMSQDAASAGDHAGDEE